MRNSKWAAVTVSLAAASIVPSQWAATAHAGRGAMNTSGEVSLTYTYVDDPTNPVTPSELTLLEQRLQDASRHLCRATDGLVKVNNWVIDPAARKSDADFIAAPRESGRAVAYSYTIGSGGLGDPGAGVAMYNDFLDASTIAHEMGHYVLGLDDQYNEQRRGGGFYGIGGLFDEENPVLSTPMTQTDNTMMADQFALVARGLEFQLSHDAVYDVRHGDDNTNQTVDEPFRTPAPTSAIVVPTWTLGGNGVPATVNLSSLASAIATSAAHSAFEIIDEGGEASLQSIGIPLDSEDYRYGDDCAFGRGSIRGWLFVEWSGGSNYKLIVAAEDRQFDGTPSDTINCNVAQPFGAITLRTLATLSASSGTQGCGDGVVTRSIGEECETSLSPGTVPCSRISGGFTSTTATTTCDPATCTWKRAGCYSSNTAFCGPLNIFGQQCYAGSTPAACVGSMGTQSCTDCLNDPKPCGHPVGSAAGFTGGNSVTFNVPNTSYSKNVHGAGPDFSVRLTVGTLSTTGPTALPTNLTVDGAGDCAIDAAKAGVCGASGGHSLSCEHICGESWSPYSGPAAPGAFEMAGGNGQGRWSAASVYADYRCQNVDTGGVQATRPGCETNGNYTGQISEWDILQYSLRTHRLTPTIKHRGLNLGKAGDPLTWGQSVPVVESTLTAATEQDCTTFTVTVKTRPPFNPAQPANFDTAFALDTSGSMQTPSNNADDPKSTTRADLATSAGVAALQMLNTAQTAPGSMSTYNVALTSFASTAKEVRGLTSNDAAGLASLTTALQGRDAPSGNTAVGDALRFAYGQVTSNARDRFIVLVSDGFHNTGDPPEDVAKQLIQNDPGLHICPVFFGEDADQSVELAQVASAGKCALRIADPSSNDIAVTMFEAAGERAGGSVLMSDRVTVANNTPPILLSTILSSLPSSTSASTELVVSPEMKNLRLLVADSGRNRAAWVAPTVTLKAPNGATITLDGTTARFNETARGYRMFDLPINGATQSGTWQMTVTPSAAASTQPVITNLSVVADRSDARCSVRLNQVATTAGSQVIVSVNSAHTLPLNLRTVNASAQVWGPSGDGTIRRFPLTLQRDQGSRSFSGRFTAPNVNGVYHVQGLCEATRPVSAVAEGGPFTKPVAIRHLPAFRVQGSAQFIVKGGTPVCRKAGDCDLDGVADSAEPAGDADGDGVPNAYEADSDDDGRLDASEVGKNDDGDGVPDIIDADMDNDGRPDYLTASCNWTTSGGNASRTGVSACRGHTGPAPLWSNSQIGNPGDGVTLDRDGTAYFNATTSILLQQSLVAVRRDGTVKWTAPMRIAATTNPEVIEASDLVAVGDVDGEVLAFNGAGKIAWTHYTDFPVRALVARGNRVYASTQLGGLYAIDAFTGKRVWSQLSLLVPWGIPALSADGSTLYVTYGLNLVSVDASSGKVNWSKTFPMTFLNSLTVGANGDIYAAALDGALYRFNGSTGAQVWRYGLPFLSNVVRQPVVDGANIYFGASNGNVYALRDGATPTVLWTRSLGAGVSGIPVKATDGIYAGSSAGRIYSLALSTGAIQWQAAVPSAIGGTIAIGDKRLLFTDSSGKLYSY